MLGFMFEEKALRYLEQHPSPRLGHGAIIVRKQVAADNAPRWQAAHLSPLTSPIVQPHPVPIRPLPAPPRLWREKISRVRPRGGRRRRLGAGSDGVLPDDDPLLRREPHRIARLDAKGSEERVGVTQRLGSAHHIGRVGVVTNEELQRLRADLDAPGGRGGDEEALLRRERRRDGDSAGVAPGAGDAARAVSSSPRSARRAAYAFWMPPRSAEFSMTVNCPLTKSPGATSIAEYCAARASFSARNRCRSSAVHQSRRFPSPSNCDPPRSKPCVISWPAMKPMPPRLDAASAS